MQRIMQKTSALDQYAKVHGEVDLPTRPGLPLQREGPLDGAPSAMDDVDLALELGTDRADDAAFCLQWRTLVANSHSPQKIYQTPEYFQFVRDSAAAGVRLELLLVTKRSTGAIVAVVPLQISTLVLHFKLGPVTLWRVPVAVASVLGSIPAGPAEAGLAERLVWRALALFPNVKAVYMQALPRASEHWRDLTASIGSGSGLAAALIGPWESCHTLPLPVSFEQYLNRFSAKKRYNLNRQMRQLGQHAGELELVRIDRPEQLSGMMGALTSLLSGAEMSALLRAETYARLAEQGLLLSYVLHGNGVALAAVVGTRSPDALHVHNIFVGDKYRSLSVGTTVMHLVVEDLVSLGGIGRIDFGYGTPNHDFRSSHVLETRAKVLVFDGRRSVSLLFFIHTVLTRFSELLARAVKAVRKHWRSVRAISGKRAEPEPSGK